jgi:hypothetical protein
MANKEKVLKLLKDQTCDHCEWLARFARTKEPACLLKVCSLPKSLMCDEFERSHNRETDFYGIAEISGNDEKRHRRGNN